MREDEMVSEPLRLSAHVLDNGEVCWGGDDIVAALREIAGAGQVILGFDMLEPLSGGKLRPWGTSGYSVDSFLESKPWDECVTLALDAAIRDVHDTQRLTGLKPPYSDLWYCVTSVDQLGEAKLRKLPREIWVRRSEKDPGQSP